MPLNGPRRVPRPRDHFHARAPIAAADLRDRGAISAEEFETKKRDLLNRL